MGHLDRKALKIRGFRSFFLFCEIDMRLKIEVRPCITHLATRIESCCPRPL